MSDTPLDLDAQMKVVRESLDWFGMAHQDAPERIAEMRQAVMASIGTITDALRASRAEVERLRELVEADNARWRYLRRDPEVMRYLYDVCSVKTGDDGAAEMRVWIDWSVENDAKIEAKALAQPGEVEK